MAIGGSAMEEQSTRVDEWLIVSSGRVRHRRPALGVGLRPLSNHRAWSPRLRELDRVPPFLRDPIDRARAPTPGRADEASPHVWTPSTAGPWLPRLAEWWTPRIVREMASAGVFVAGFPVGHSSTTRISGSLASCWVSCAQLSAGVAIDVCRHSSCAPPVPRTASSPAWISAWQVEHTATSFPRVVLPPCMRKTMWCAWSAR